MQQLYSTRDFAGAGEPSLPHVLGSGSRARAAGRSCVLVVDDDSGVRMMAARALENAGYAVLGASDGIQALELLECSGIGVDLVLTDIRMPRLGGLELGREIVARQWTIPVLYMSADPPGALHPSVGGVNPRCLQKPFTMAALVAIVAQLLAA